MIESKGERQWVLRFLLVGRRSILLAIIVFGLLTPSQVSSADSQSETVASQPPDFSAKSAGDSKELVSGITFHWCPAGTFLMGQADTEDDERPVEVTLSKGFWLGETEVTQSQFQSLTKSAPWRGRNEIKSPENAASYLSFADATKYCEKLTTQERMAGRLAADWKYALPTGNAESVPGGQRTETKFCYGDDESLLGDYAWYAQERLGCRRAIRASSGKEKRTPGVLRTCTATSGSECRLVQWTWRKTTWWSRSIGHDVPAAGRGTPLPWRLLSGKTIILPFSLPRRGFPLFATRDDWISNCRSPGREVNDLFS